MTWDHDAFKTRCLVLAAKQGLSAQDLCVKANLSRFFFDKPLTLGPTVSTVMRLAKILEVSPAFLAWGDTPHR